MGEPDPSEATLLVDRVVVAVGAVGIVVLAGFVLAPLWAPIIFAVWTAVLLDPFTGWIARLGRCHRAIGAGVTTAFVALLLVPLGLLLASLVSSVMAFVRELLALAQAREAIEMLVSTEHVGEGQKVDINRWIELAQAHGATAWQGARSLAGASAWVLVVLLVFFITLYECLAVGRAMWTWAKDHSPLHSQVTTRLAAAFVETGRGLIVGAGLTSLLQATLATGLYAALGVQRAIVLGAFTFVASFIPAIGTSILWIPVAVGLGFRGAYGRAAILVIIGAFGISTIDNITRPLFQRWGGKLDLPAFLLLLAAFGGLNAFGPAGLALGPLALRLTREILAIARERRDGARVQLPP